jgi:hypothetical protein
MSSYLTQRLVEAHAADLQEQAAHARLARALEVGVSARRGPWSGAIDHRAQLPADGHRQEFW